MQKYAYMEDWSEGKLPDLQAEHDPNLKDFIPAIDDWMEADRKVPRKRRHTAMRIYHRWQAEPSKRRFWRGCLFHRGNSNGLWPFPYLKLLLERLPFGVSLKPALERFCTISLQITGRR